MWLHCLFGRQASEAFARRGATRRAGAEDRHADAHFAARLGDARQRGDRQIDARQVFQRLLADDDVKRVRRRARIARHQVVGDDRGVAFTAIDRLDLDLLMSEPCI